MYANAIYTNSIVVNGLEIVSGTTLEANIVVSRLTANIITTNTIIVNGLEIVNGTSGEANLAVSRITANIIFANNFILNGVPLSNLQSQVSNLTTDQVTEGTNNLYYTNSRARTAYTPGQNITIAANGQISATTSAILGSLAEANIQGNLRVTGTVTANGFVSTGVGVPTLVSSSNINIIASSGEVTITTKNLRVAGNLIVTNSITANSITINGIEIVTGGTNEANIAATRINTNSITANIWNNLYTANVVETSGNLYFTNTRVVSALTGGYGIVIAANGRLTITAVGSGSYGDANVYANVSLIGYATNSRIDGLTTSDIPEGSRPYFNNTRAISAFTAGSGISISPTGTIASTGGVSGNYLIDYGFVYESISSQQDFGSIL